MPTRTWNRRWARNLNDFGGEAGYYGDQWGDPSLGGLALLWRRVRRGERPPGDLAKVLKHYLSPYVTADASVLEIGPGGGRWTQFLMPAREIVLVDLNAEFFPYLEDRFRDHAAKLRFYQTSGYELAGVETESVDFVFSFGTFVHIRPRGIDEYLGDVTPRPAAWWRGLHSVRRPHEAVLRQCRARGLPRLLRHEWQEDGAFAPQAPVRGCRARPCGAEALERCRFHEAGQCLRVRIGCRGPAGVQTGSARR